MGFLKMGIKKTKRSIFLFLAVLLTILTCNYIFVDDLSIFLPTSLFKKVKEYYFCDPKCRKYFYKSNFISKIITNSQENIFGNRSFIPSKTFFATTPDTMTDKNGNTAASLNTQKIPDIIFFLNYNDQLQTTRYLCSIESAVLHNPISDIIIYVKKVDEFNNGILQWKMQSPNLERIKVLAINYEAFFKNTPLESWYLNKKFEKSWWVEQNLGNAFRLAALWVHGGTYLDLDIISVNPITDHKNGKKVPLARFIAREEPEQLNNAALRFPEQDPFVWAVMESFVEHWNGYTWANNGPFCITRTFREKCRDKITSSSDTDNTPLNDYCYDLLILDSARFYPIHFRKTKYMMDEFTEQCDLLANIAQHSYAVHWWHKGFESDEKKNINMSRTSVLGQLFAVQCPVVVSFYGWEALYFK